MPEQHRRHAEWTPERLIRWAVRSGEATAAVVEQILARRPLPQQGFRACLGVMRLGERYGPDRLEAACRRAVATGACSYKSIESILKCGLDRQSVPEKATPTPVIKHDNIRGADYYAPELPLGEEGGRPC